MSKEAFEQWHETVKNKPIQDYGYDSLSKDVARQAFEAGVKSCESGLSFTPDNNHSISEISKEAFDEWCKGTGRTVFDAELFEAWQACAAHHEAVIADLKEDFLDLRQQVNYRCAVADGFINIQESLCGFGDSPNNAVIDLKSQVPEGTKLPAIVKGK